MAKKKPARTSTGKRKAAKTVSKSKKKSSAVAKTKKPSKAKSSGPKKKSSTSKSVASKKKSSKLSSVNKGKGSIAAKPSKAKKSTTKSSKKSPSKPRGRSGSPSHTPTTARPSLSAQDRYNAGGLLTCAIDRDGDPGSRKLRKALKLLQLSTLEQENLVRLSQGFTIPKLFADELSDEGIRRLVVKEVVNSVKGEGNYERDWQDDLRLFASWLGVTI